MIEAFSPIAPVPSTPDAWAFSSPPGEVPASTGALVAPKAGEITANGTTPGYGTWLEYLRTGFGASEIQSFGSDFYDRLHISTALLALGNVIGLQSRDITLWNAYRRAQPLAAVSAAGDDGIELTGGPGALPYSFSPFEEITYTVTLGTSGPPAIDAAYTFDFEPYDLVLRITGSRVVAWSFIPDWSSGVLERLEWQTDVLQSYDASEQRASLRLAPRKRYEFEAFFVGRERRYAESLLWGWGARSWALPVFPDGQDLVADVAQGATLISVDTVARDFAAESLAVIMTDAFTFEVIEVDSVDAGTLALKRPTTRAWPGTARIYPARIARISGAVTAARWDANNAGAKMAFDVIEPVDYEADAGAAVHRGHPVLELKPDWSGDFSLELQRKLAEIDYGTGLRAYDDESGLPGVLQRMRWTLTTREELDAFRKLLYALRGKAVSVWVPTWEDDLIPVAVIGDTAQAIDVEWTAYTLQLEVDPGRRDLRIELVDGSVFYRRVLGSLEISSEVERLQIDQALGVTVLPGSVAKISFMALCRNDSDATELAYWTGDVAESAGIFRSFRTDD